MNEQPNLLESLTREAEDYRRRAGQVRACVVFLGVLYVIAMVVGFVRHRTVDFTLVYGLLLLSSGIVAGLTNEHKWLIRSSAELEDIRALGPLIDVLDTEDETIRQIARAAVLRLLAGADQATLETLTSEQRQKLASRVLAEKKEKDAAEWIAASRHAPFARAIPVLETVAAGHPRVTDRAAKERLANLSRMALGDIRIALARTAVDAAEGKSRDQLSQSIQQLPSEPDVPLDVQNR